MKLQHLFLIVIFFSFTPFNHDRNISSNLFSPKSDLVFSGDHTFDFVKIPKGVTLWVENDLTLKSRSDIVIEGSVLCSHFNRSEKLSNGSNISFESSKKIIIQGTVIAGDGSDGPMSYVTGYQGGNISLIAKEIILNKNLKAGDGGDGGLNATGGKGGSILLFGRVRSPDSDKITVYGGKGGNGGNGEAGKEGGEGGCGGNAIILGNGANGADGSPGTHVTQPDAANGTDGAVCADGGAGSDGAGAIGGPGGNGGKGGDGTPPFGNGGNGGKGGNGGIGHGGNGGIGGIGGNCATGPAGNGGLGGNGGNGTGGNGGQGGNGGNAFVEGNGGNGGDGGWGGNARGGNGGVGGFGGNGNSTFAGGNGGKGGNAGNANGGAAGNGGNGGNGIFGSGGNGGNGGAGGITDSSSGGNGGAGGSGNPGGIGGSGGVKGSSTPGPGGMGGIPGIGTPPGVPGINGSPGWAYQCYDGIPGINGTNLPIELITFFAQSKGNFIVFHWETATEINNKGFEIQQSSDGDGWTTIVFVAGKGTTYEKQKYYYNHQSEIMGDLYFRLRQLDFDGNFCYSNTVYLNICDHSKYIMIYPNPGTSRITINLNSNNIFSFRYDILTYTGEIIYSEKIPPSNLTNGTFEINLQFLPKGNYILFTDVNGKGNGTKIVIQ